MGKPDILGFRGGGSCPVQYYLSHSIHEYYVRYRHGYLSVDIDGKEEFGAEIGDDLDGSWTDEETTVYLSIISDAIRSANIRNMTVPHIDDCPHNAFYQKGPLPLRPVGLICGHLGPSNSITSTIQTGNRHHRKRRRNAGIHDHDVQCIAHVAPKDIIKWINDHKEEHKAFQREYKEEWGIYLRLQHDYRSK